jgi:EAL domain-containing protein (putative c-di-GMP-specific phosphodiesterase class I)
MSVTAEGVETIAETDARRDIGCKHAQGYLFGKPVSAADTLALLKKGGGGVMLAA